MSAALKSSTVQAALSAAEAKRQRDRAKNKKRRSSGGSAAGGGSGRRMKAPPEHAEKLQRTQRENVPPPDEDGNISFSMAEETKEPELEEEQEAEQQQEEEEEKIQDEEEPQEEDATMVDVEQADEHEQERQQEEEAGGEEEEHEEEELPPSDDDDEASQQSDDSSVAVDIVHVDDDEETQQQETDASVVDEDGDGSLLHASPPSTPSATHPTSFTSSSHQKSKKRSSSSLTPSAVTFPSFPSLRLSTFRFTSDQISYSSRNHGEYTLRFRADEILTFHGSIAFTVEEGYVEVYGHLFTPRSERVRGNGEKTCWFNVHSWQHQAHALLSFRARTSATANAYEEEFITTIKIRKCTSRFTTQRLLETLNEEKEENCSASEPMIMNDPYDSSDAHSSVAASASSSLHTPSKSASSKKKKKQKLEAASNIVASPATSTTSTKFMRINIPGFTPVAYSDDDYRRVDETSDSSSPVPLAQRFIYSTLSIEEDWQTSIQSMLQPQAQATTAASHDDDDSAAASFSSSSTPSKARLAAQKLHLKGLRSHILTNGLRIIVYGQRNTGKSTLLSYMLNVALTKYSKVLYMDLDVGQCTFNPSGMLTLHEVTSPVLSTMSHVQAGRGVVAGQQQKSKMVWSYYLGDVTHTTNPSAVLHAIHSATQYYERYYSPSQSTSFVPLLVNTQGWLTGLGLDILKVCVKDIIKPVYIVSLQLDKDETAPATRKRKEQDEDDDSSSSVIGELTYPHQTYTFRRRLTPAVAASLVTSSTIATAMKLRQLQLLAYFTSGASYLRASIPFTLSSYSTLTSSLKPYRVPFSSMTLELLGMNVGKDYQPSSILTILDTAVVGLCIKDEKHRYEEVRNEKYGLKIVKMRETIPPFYPASSSAASSFTLPPPPLDRCLGLGLIRSIDLTNCCFHILTPLTLLQLTSVNLLQKGKMDTPNVVYGIDAHAERVVTKEEQQKMMLAAQMPYLSNSSLTAGSGLGSREMASRNNLQRKKFN